jgi:hypothetical protein
MRGLIIAIAGAQAALIGLFAAFAASGDAWGIARAMALLLSLPFVALSVPALGLMWKGYPKAAALLALLSAAVTWAAWAFA